MTPADGASLTRSELEAPGSGGSAAGTASATSPQEVMARASCIDPRVIARYGEGATITGSLADLEIGPE